MVFIFKRIRKHADSFLWVIGISKPYRNRVIIITAISMLTSLTGVGFAILTRRLIDTATGAMRSSSGLLGAAFSLGSVIVFQLALQSFLMIYTTNTTENFQSHIRKRLFSKICGSPWSSLDLHSGDIMTRMRSDVSNIVSIHVTLIPQIAALFAQLTAAFLTLVSYDGVMAAAAFLLGPFVMFFAQLYARKLKPLYENYQSADSAEKAFLQESIQNILLIKTFQLFKPFMQKLEGLQSDKIGWVYKRNRISVFANAGLSAGYWLGVLTALLWGSYRLSLGLITFGTVTAFVQLVGQVQGPFIGLSRAFPSLVQSIVSGERLMVIDSLQQETSDYVASTGLRAGLAIDHVGCGYKTKSNVLRDISINIKPGEMTGIMGPTGDGKTTLIRLMLSLIRPDKGTVFIYTDDGRKFEASSKTRSFFSYVPQGNTLLSGTIAENLRLGRPDANEEEIKQALRDACAWDFVSALSDGIHTFVGEKGATLSEGQAQRIAVARALLYDTPILLLDEATSALDSETENKVIESIRLKGKTCIFVSHRAILFDKCDSVYRIIDGRLSKSEKK